MPYSVDRYSVPTTYVVEDGTIDSSLDIKLIGKNYAGYGEVQNENFLHLLENFAGTAAPPRPIAGQVWYDSATKKLKFYDSSSTRWKPTGGAEVASAAPVGLTKGDFWYDSTNKQIYVYDETEYVLVGPQGVAGQGTTQLKSITVTDNATGAVHAVITALVDGAAVFIISVDEFTLSTVSAELLPGFTLIKKGITLIDTRTNGSTTGNLSPVAKIWGTSSASVGLVNNSGQVLTYADFVQTGDYGSFLDAGFTVGTGSDKLIVKIDTDGETSIIRTATGSGILKLQTYSGDLNNPYTPLRLAGQHTLPGADETNDLGATSTKFRNLYARTIYGDGGNITGLNATQLTQGTVPSARLTGSYSINVTGSAATATTATTATQADSLKVDSVYRTATVDTASTGTANSIATRDADGNLNAVLFQGTATSALFADLAEKYLADQEYEIGTVVVVGGELEVTACSLGERAFGAVSGSPAFMMNEGLEGGTYIALKGRVPVKVVGPVRKGDKLIAADNGCAGVAHAILKNLPVRAGNFPDTFAIALENNDDDGVKLVEAIIL
jgi:hypothetical protein